MPNEEASWREALPEDMRDNPAIKDFTDVGALAKSYMETKSMVGSSIRIPGEDAGAEDWNAFNARLADKVPGMVRIAGDDDQEGLNALWTKLGRPVTDDGYQAPEGVEVSADDIATAKELGLTSAQFQKYVKLESAREDEGANAAKAAQDASKNEVLGEWGAAKEQKLRQIRIMLESTGAPDAVKEVMAELNVGGEFLKWAETIVTSIGGEAQNFGNDGDQGTTGIMTPDEATAQLAEMMANPAHPFHNKLDPGHKAALQKMVDLHDLKAGRVPQNKI